MKSFFFKDFLNLYNYNKIEFKNLSNKIIQIEFNVFVHSKHKLHYKSFCNASGRRRSIYNFFLLSRMAIKKNLNLLKINGLKKIS